ncbi:hypothetical protein SISSUDRAFT_265548 [Sistotremastrum suecicum HHB10207 ss-3]|uniref:Uncharacterized protein n=1 Tax=Sistotremastrum suecicum HHB10207 ss-3 TaxID=1314776 RepID=A0A166GFN4_9AGAM|nr:hypothetical protein SISSUDRAFT_265548 [Sistotremastrum suecicum HHB10207 ss-3]
MATNSLKPIAEEDIGGETLSQNGLDVDTPSKTPGSIDPSYSKSSAPHASPQRIKAGTRSVHRPSLSASSIILPEHSDGPLLGPLLGPPLTEQSDSRPSSGPPSKSPQKNLLVNTWHTKKESPVSQPSLEKLKLGGRENYQLSKEEIAQDKKIVGSHWTPHWPMKQPTPREHFEEEEDEEGTRQDAEMRSPPPEFIQGSSNGQILQRPESTQGFSFSPRKHLAVVHARKKPMGRVRFSSEEYMDSEDDEESQEDREKKRRAVPSLKPEKERSERPIRQVARKTSYRMSPLESATDRSVFDSEDSEKKRFRKAARKMAWQSASSSDIPRDTPEHPPHLNDHMDHDEQSTLPSRHSSPDKRRLETEDVNMAPSDDFFDDTMFARRPSFPFLQRNLRKGFEARFHRYSSKNSSSTQLLEIDDPPEPYQSDEPTLRHSYTVPLRSWACPLCALFPTFDTREKVFMHLKWDHPEVSFKFILDPRASRTEGEPRYWNIKFGPPRHTNSDSDDESPVLLPLPQPPPTSPTLLPLSVPPQAQMLPPISPVPSATDLSTLAAPLQDPSLLSPRNTASSNLSPAQRNRIVSAEIALSEFKIRSPTSNSKRGTPSPISRGGTPGISGKFDFEAHQKQAVGSREQSPTAMSLEEREREEQAVEDTVASLVLETQPDDSGTNMHSSKSKGEEADVAMEDATLSRESPPHVPQSLDRNDAEQSSDVAHESVNEDNTALWDHHEPEDQLHDELMAQQEPLAGLVGELANSDALIADAPTSRIKTEDVDIELNGGGSMATPPPEEERPSQQTPRIKFAIKQEDLARPFGTPSRFKHAFPRARSATPWKPKGGPREPTPDDAIFIDDDDDDEESPQSAVTSASPPAVADPPTTVKGFPEDQDSAATTSSAFSPIRIDSDVPRVAVSSKTLESARSLRLRGKQALLDTLESLSDFSGISRTASPSPNEVVSLVTQGVESAPPDPLRSAPLPKSQLKLHPTLNHVVPERSRRLEQQVPPKPSSIARIYSTC